MLNPLATDWLTRPDGLAPRLQALRTDAGLTGTDLADRAGWHQSKVSRIETGKQLPSVLAIRTWAGLCDATESEAQELLDLLGDVQAVHLDWKRRTGRGQVAVQASYSELVEGSKLIRHFETAVVPGLLQTSEYARCIAVEAASIHGTDDDPDQVVAAKLQRQRFLYDSTKQFEFLMAEPVLRWLPCPPTVMRAQLDRLQTVIGVPNVRLGIIPLGVRLDITPQNNFVLYDDVAKVETFVGESSHTGDEAATTPRSWTASGPRPPRETPPDDSSSAQRTSCPNTDTRPLGDDVAHLLVDLAEEGTPSGTGVLLRNGLTQDDLAGMVGASRSSVARALATLRELGFVSTGRRQVAVLDLAGLREFAG